jgi:FixJ family two-component response regulator
MIEPYPVVHIVDDDPAVRDSLDLLLRLRGYRTRTFDSGDALLAAVEPLFRPPLGDRRVGRP